MSDQSQGPGWWQASDGQWYPPEQHPDFGQGGPPTEAMEGGPPTMPPAPPVTAPVGPSFLPPGTPPPDGPPVSGPPPMGGAPLGGPPPVGGPPPLGGPPPGAPPSRSGLGRGPLIGIIVAVVVVVALAAFVLTRDSGGNKENAATSSELGSDSSSSSTKSKSSSSSSSTKSSNSSKSSAGTPSGFKTITDDASGVSIAVPNSFKQVDASKLAGSVNSSELGSVDSDLAPFAGGAEAFLGNAVLAASGTESGVPTFIVVGSSPEAQALDPTNPDIISVLKTELESFLPGSTVDATTVTLPAGPAIRVNLSLSVADSGTVSETLFFVKTPKGTFAIVGASPGGGSNADLMDQVAQTFSAG